MTKLRLLALACCATVVYLCQSQSAVAQFDFEAAPISYSTATPDNRISRLQADIDTGEKTLQFGERNGYLADLLAALDISPESQMLVFSQTSFQLRKISPQQPRALYFNDDTYIGWVQQGDVIEVATTDAKLGCVFYTLDLEPQDSPKFKRDQGNCLTCHISSRTQGVPGLMVRSVFPSKSGVPLYGAGTFDTDQASPFEQRWGGWYVSGTHGAQRHMGNVICQARDRAELDREAGANRADLKDIVNTEPYLTAHSDIAALMVHEHQTQMHNMITLANYEYTMATHYDKLMNEAMKRDPSYESESTVRRIDAACDKLLRQLLFCNEFKLTAPIKGSSKFTESFAAQGPFDETGRGLRQFDLNTRIFKYPCSYLIYSPFFDQLPAALRFRVYTKLAEILSPDSPQSKELTGTKKTPPDGFAHLSLTDRVAIREILVATKPEFAATVNRTQ